MKRCESADLDTEIRKFCDGHRRKTWIASGRGDCHTGHQFDERPPGKEFTQAAPQFAGIPCVEADESFSLL